MEKVKVYIKGQEDKELYSFLRYYPMRIKNVGIEEIFSRQMVYDFKSGLLQQSIAKCVAKELVKTYGRKVKNVVFSCIPASSQEKNEVRNKAFQPLYVSSRVPLTAIPMLRYWESAPQFMGRRSRKRPVSSV